MKTFIHLSFLSSLLVLACSPAKAPEPAPAEPQPEVKADPFQEIADEKIEFIKMFPGAAQKNIYMTWKLYENSETKAREYRVDNKAVSEEAAAAIADLRNAIDKSLIPSDGIYSCRFEPGRAQYRLELNKDGHHYSIVSNSDCLHAAPFNVRLDNDPGQWSLQISGEIGIALEKALKLSGSSIDHIGETAAMIVLDKHVEIDGYEARPLEPGKIRHPRDYFNQVFTKNSEIVRDISNRAGLPEVACNQAQSADCTTLQARYSIPLGNNMYYRYPLKYSEDTVNITHKDVTSQDLKTLNTFKDSLWFKVYWAAVCQQKVSDFLADASQEKIVYHPEKEEGNLADFVNSDAFKKASNTAGTWLPIVEPEQIKAYFQSHSNLHDKVFIPDNICPEIQLSFAQNERTANYLKGIQKHLSNRDKSTITRGETWTLKAKDLPALVYYPEVNTFWIESKDNAQTIVDAYCQSKYIISDKTYPFGGALVVPDFTEAERTKSETVLVKKLCSAKSPKISPNLNIYFGDREILAIFKTENGKTTVE